MIQFDVTATGAYVTYYGGDGPPFFAYVPLPAIHRVAPNKVNKWYVGALEEAKDETEIQPGEQGRRFVAY